LTKWGGYFFRCEFYYIENMKNKNFYSALFISVLLLCNFSGVLAAAQLQHGGQENIGQQWTFVSFAESCPNAVVVCTPISLNINPGIVVVRNVTEFGFEVKLVPSNPAASETASVAISYMAVPAGEGVLDGGLRYQAQVLSIHQFCTPKQWKEIKVNNTQNLAQPVVFGQVIQTGTETVYASFFYRGSARNKPASESSIYVGAHAGADLRHVGQTVQLSVIVLEAGVYQLNQQILEVSVTGQSVGGYKENYNLPISRDIVSECILGCASMNTSDGGYATIQSQMDAGQLVLNNSKLTLAIGEDQFEDDETNHAREYCSMALFSPQLAPPHITPEPVAVFPHEGGLIGVETQLSAQGVYGINEDPNQYTSGNIGVVVDGQVDVLAQKDGLMNSRETSRRVVITSLPETDLENGLIYIALNPVWGQERVTYNIASQALDFSVKSSKLIDQISLPMGSYQLASLEGYLLVPESGTYTITLDKGSSGSADFYIENLSLPAISRTVTGNPPNKVTRYFDKGFYPVRLIVASNYWSNAVSLSWTGPGLTQKTLIGAGYIYHSAQRLQAVLESLDSDGDGLTDAQELALGTNKSNRDSDGDGLSDFEETQTYNTNALSDCAKINLLFWTNGIVPFSMKFICPYINIC
jgi:hypothetical protein